MLKVSTNESTVKIEYSLPVNCKLMDRFVFKIRS